MSKSPKWIRGSYLGDVSIRTWPLKKEMPPHLREIAKRWDFGLFGQHYVALDWERKVLLADDRGWMPVTPIFYLNTPGPVISPCDMSAVDCFPWSQEFRAAFSRWRMEG